MTHAVTFLSLGADPDMARSFKEGLSQGIGRLYPTWNPAHGNPLHGMAFINWIDLHIRCWLGNKPSKKKADKAVDNTVDTATDVATDTATDATDATATENSPALRRRLLMDKADTVVENGEKAQEDALKERKCDAASVEDIMASKKIGGGNPWIAVKGRDIPRYGNLSRGDLNKKEDGGGESILGLSGSFVLF